jgi:hypothetical protein
MKTLLLALSLVTFVVASQADEAKPTKKAKDTSSCCAAKNTQQVKAMKSKDECSGCCKEKQVAKLMSPKAAADMGR